jgi:hypothetical protein
MQLSMERAEQGAEFESAERDGSPATAADRAAMRSTRRQSAGCPVHSNPNDHKCL